MWDVIVVGAGMSGIAAAQRLSQSGYRVLVLDKSRGVGGRMATRRVTWPDGHSATVAVDHGCRFLQPSTSLGKTWLTDDATQNVLKPWSPAEFTLEANGQCHPKMVSGSTRCAYYTAPQGMSAWAKTLATGLTIQRQSRVTQVWPVPEGWRVDWVNEAGQGEGGNTEPLMTKALVLALPAAQIVPLVAAAADHDPALAPFLAAAAAVTFDPVITVMAGYAPTLSAVLTPSDPAASQVTGWMVWASDHPSLRWIALDSSKRPHPPYPVVVAHSTATFAAHHFEAEDLPQVGQNLLDQAAPSLGNWLAQPDWMQVHRWRYGFVNQAHPTEVLSVEAVPTLVGCGDWCGGKGAEEAMRSGEAAAHRLMQAVRANLGTGH